LNRRLLHYIKGLKVTRQSLTILIVRLYGGIPFKTVQDPVDVELCRMDAASEREVLEMDWHKRCNLVASLMNKWSLKLKLE
jgi:hypothetical protein